MTVPVIIQPATARPPAYALLVKPGLAGDIGKGPVPVVVEQNVVTVKATEQIIPSVIVIVAHAHTRLPASARQTRVLRYVSKRSITVVFIQMRGRGFCGWPGCIQTRPIGQINIQPTVIVKVEKC